MEHSPSKPHTKTTCIKNSNAFFVCADQKCLKSNPFICSDQSCQCFLTHEECKQIRINVFNKKIQALSTLNQNQLQELKNKVNNYFDKVIDKLSEQRDKIISQINKGKSNWILKNDSQNLPQIKKFKEQQQINGELVSRLLKYSQKTKQLSFEQQVIKRQTWQSFLLNIKNISDQFIEKYVKNFKQLLFKEFDLFQLDINYSMCSIQNFQNRLIGNQIVQSLMYIILILNTPLQKQSNFQNQFICFPSFLRKFRQQQTAITLALQNRLNQHCSLSFNSFKGSNKLQKLLAQQFCYLEQNFKIQQLTKNLQEFQELPKLFNTYLIIKYESCILSKLVSLARLIQKSFQTTKIIPELYFEQVYQIIARIGFIYKQNLQNKQLANIRKNSKSSKKLLSQLLLAALIRSNFKLKINTQILSYAIHPNIIKQFKMLNWSQNQNIPQSKFFIENYKDQMQTLRKNQRNQYNLLIMKMAKLTFNNQFLQKSDIMIKSRKIIDQSLNGRYSILNKQTGQLQLPPQPTIKKFYW